MVMVVILNIFSTSALKRAQHLGRAPLWLALLLLGGCLEKQPDTELIIDGSYGGVGGSTTNLGETRIGNVTGVNGGEGSKSHEEVTHSDRAPGFGQEGDIKPPPGVAPPNPGSTSATASGEDAPAHEEQAHVDRPPGFGLEGSEGDAPPGAPGGSQNATLPNIPSPFEEKHKGEEMVLVSGVISAPDGIAGIGDMDCFVPAPESPARRSFVNKIKVRVPGSYEMKVPKNYGPLLISVFLDLDQDGPDPADPQGSYEDSLEIEGEDLTGVDITLLVRAP